METKENGGSGGTKEYERVNCLVQNVMKENIKRMLTLPGLVYFVLVKVFRNNC